MNEYTAQIRYKISGTTCTDTLDERITAKDENDARIRLQLKYPDCEVSFVRMVWDSEPKITPSSSSSSSHESSGGGGFISLLAISFLAVAVFVPDFRSKLLNFIGVDRTSISEANEQEYIADIPHTQAPVASSGTGIEAEKVSEPDSFSRVEARLEPSGRESDATVDDTHTDFPYRARINDRREDIVIQSGPRMSSRNIAKVPSGSVVRASSNDSNWVQIQTDSGLVGFVRLRQLEFLDQPID